MTSFLSFDSSGALTQKMAAAHKQYISSFLPNWLSNSSFIYDRAPLFRNRSGLSSTIIMLHIELSNKSSIFLSPPFRRQLKVRASSIRVSSDRFCSKRVVNP